METLKLKVTSKVINQAARAPGQQQIAISSPTGLLAVSISEANKKNRFRIRLADALTLQLGDTGAIWRAHNIEHEQDFDSLFDFLSGYPDKEFEFVCTVEQ